MELTGGVGGVPIDAAGLSATVEVATEPMSLRAVIFDLDGVLTDTASIHRAAWKQTLDGYLARSGARGQRPFDEDDYRRYVDGRSRQEGIRAFLASRGITLGEGDAGDPPELDSVQSLAAQKDRAYLDRLGQGGVSAFPPSVALVRDLRRAGVATAVASASHHCAAVLAAAGIADLFDARVDGMDADRLGLPGKPDPALFLEAARRLGIAPAQAAVVEDAEAGVEAARRGGFGLVVGIARGARGRALRERGADLVVPDLSALPSRVLMGAPPDPPYP